MIKQIAIERQYDNAWKEEEILLEEEGSFTLKEALSIIEKGLKTHFKQNSFDFTNASKGGWPDNQVKLVHCYGPENRGKMACVYITGDKKDVQKLVKGMTE